MKRYDWIKFYPDDWNGDFELATCSYRTQGVYARLLAVLHRSEPYGHLLCNGSEPTPRDVCKATGIPPNTYRASLSELLEKGVLKRDDQGRIYSERMVRDQQEREEMSRRGSMGGNPDLVKQEVKQKDKQEVNQEVKPDIERDKDIDKEGEKTNPPPIKHPAGWEPTEQSTNDTMTLLHRLEKMFGVWPITSKQMGNGEAEIIKTELAAILRLLSADEVVEIVRREMEARVVETKGVDRPVNLKWYMPFIKDAFFARDRQQEEADRRRDEEKKRRKRDPADDPVPIADLIEDELTEEDRAKIRERIAKVREKMATKTKG